MEKYALASVLVLSSLRLLFAYWPLSLPLHLLALAGHAILAVSLVGSIFLRPILIRLRDKDAGPAKLMGIAGRTAAVALLAVGSLALVNVGYPPLRAMAMKRITENGQPLVDAINEFEKARGQPPSDLSELVPSFIDSIPGTGVPAYPDFEYRREGAGWTVRVDTPIGIINFDFLYYDSKQQYGELASKVTRIGTWAYYRD